MADCPGHFRAVSLHLSRVLDEVGLSEEVIRRRQHVCLQQEKIFSISCDLTDRIRHAFYFGSQIEGSTIEGMQSDMDTLHCYNTKTVIQDWAEWGEREDCLLVIQGGNIPAGYCRLQQLRRDVPMPRTDVPQHVAQHYVIDDEGRVILKSDCFYSGGPAEFKRHGPAITSSNKPGLIDQDHVFGFRCNTWSSQAQRWLEEAGSRHWPSADLAESVRDTGFFLVPVGHRMSHCRDLEWRISPSLTERSLMMSLNNTQIKCYAVLKMVKKYFISPAVGDAVSSFIMKTILFYWVESTEPSLWQEENLLKCIRFCLCRLMNNIIHGDCPNYLIPGENLLSGRISQETKRILMDILEKLIRSEGRFLLMLQFDKVGKRLAERLSTDSFGQSRITLQALLCFGKCEFFKYRLFLQRMNRLILKETGVDRRSEYHKTVRGIYNYIAILQDPKYRQDACTTDGSRLFLSHLQIILGSLLASYSIQEKGRMPSLVLTLFKAGARLSMINAQLKLASILYCTGQLTNASRLLEDIEKRFNSGCVKSVCACFDENCGIMMGESFLHCVYTTTTLSQVMRLFACCVQFMPQEINCCPPAMRLEFDRSTEEDRQHRHAIHDDWMALAVVDAPVFLYYLQFITYADLGKRSGRAMAAQKKVALENLSHVQSQHLAHRETALNLFGKCLEDDDQPEGALKCYQKSLQVRPRNNAAAKHMRDLRSRMCREGRELVPRKPASCQSVINAQQGTVQYHLKCHIGFGSKLELHDFL